ncbi:MAG: Holliday junction resolvase RuvX [Candidatus Chisholmbacteria bacterium]|nr:Holliday junction resolvase RuvX [Candidatus Chisholmbacteria bacterium]
MTFLGLDYGRKRIGVALAEKTLATPLTVLANNPQVTRKIISLYQKYRSHAIVLGISEGKMAQETREFAKLLKAHLKAPLYLHDETLTSYEANLKLLHHKKSKRRKPQDAYQAALMLQDFLDTHPKIKPMLE